MEQPSYWSVNKIFIGKPQKRLMIVFRTPPCSRLSVNKRCFVCGFDRHCRDVLQYDISAQFHSLKEIIRSEDITHIDCLSSGSLLDAQQVNYRQVLQLIEHIGETKGVKSVLIEGRVEYCDIDKLKMIKEKLSGMQLEYGIGLEAYSDRIKNNVLKKGLRLVDYVACIKKLKDINVGVCTYVLAGIPNISPRKAFLQAKKTILKVADLYRRYRCRGRIALFPIFIVPGTPLDVLHKKNKYTIIRLEEIVKILMAVYDKVDLSQYPIFVGLDDEGLSGRHFLNCITQEQKDYLEMIERFNYTQKLCC